MGNHIITVTEFEARSISLIDEISSSGDTITITKRGQPIATVTPVVKRHYKSTKGILKGKIPDEFLEAFLNCGLSAPSEAGSPASKLRS